MNKHLRFLLVGTSALLLLLAGCKKEVMSLSDTDNALSIRRSGNNKKDHAADVATRWYDMELELIKTTPGFSPPMASRALGYTGVALYESLVGGMDNYKSLQSKLGYSYTLPASDNSYYWPAVANASLRKIISLLFTNATTTNKSLMTALYADIQNEFKKEASAAELERSEAYGELVATVIYNWSESDGYKTAASGYVLSNNPGAWQPTNGSASPLLPGWGNVRPFLASSVDAACIPSAPPIFSTDPSSEMYQQAIEVYKVVNSLTADQKAIAEYWADGGGTVTPPGHNLNIATQMIRHTQMPLADAAAVYAKMGMAAADAFISCWKGKYQYNLQRPVTYINKHIDPSWNTYIPTPPFPAYCSGHATVSGASAEVLTAVFGDNKPFVDKTHKGVYGNRNFKSFYDAANEATLSRLYGGIHYRMDNEIGLEKGRMIGGLIAALNLKK